MKKFKKMIHQRSGFTLLEILLVVAAIGILAGVVIIAINPARQFAEVNNAQRGSDIKTISDAVYQYTIDHNGATPPGVDTTLRVIGTADTGCDIGCGDHFGVSAPSPLQYVFNKLKQGFYAFAAPESATTIIPRFVTAGVDPEKVVPGDTMKVSAELQDDSGITEVRADMGGIETIPLSLVSGTEYHGIWTADWTVHDTGPIEYVTTITAKDRGGESASTDVHWFDPPASGWVSPTGYTDPGNQWSGEPATYDNNTSTYAQNTYGSAGWGQFIYLTLSSPITADRVRINADYLNAHISAVDVDVYVDGAWVNVFDGGDESTWNCQWVELPFSKGTVTQARFRYNYRVGGYWYWLYEFQFYQTVPVVSPPTCNTQVATSIQEDAAILHGVVTDDGGELCQYRFEYGPTLGYGMSTSWTGGVQSTEDFNEVIGSLATDTLYHFRAEVKNSAGTTNCPDLSFTTRAVGTGWVLPTGFQDGGSVWENETRAYDDNTVTYARSYHNINDPQWSQFLYFDHLPMHANRLRFYARGGAQVSAADIDIYKNDAWEHLYNGLFSDRQWVEQSFSEGMVSQVRVRFYAATATEGFYWELNELNLYKTSEANSSACLDLTPSLVSTYITDVPVDPTDGTPERTYYAIKKDIGGRIVVHACDAELGEILSVSR